MSATLGTAPQQGYLLDTCVLSAWDQTTHQFHAEVSNFFNAGPPANGANVYVAPMTLSEIGFGTTMAEYRDGVAKPTLRAFLAKLATYDLSLINAETAEIHQSLRARLAQTFMPTVSKTQKKKSAKFGELETWLSEFTNEKLNVQEADLWIAALAIQYDLTVATTDAKFVQHKVVPHSKLRVTLLIPT